MPGAADEGVVVYRPDGFVLDDSGEFEGEVLGRTYRGDHFLVKLGMGDGVVLEVVVRWQPVPEAGDVLKLAIEPDGAFVAQA